MSTFKQKFTVAIICCEPQTEKKKKEQEAKLSLG